MTAADLLGTHYSVGDGWDGNSTAVGNSSASSYAGRNNMIGLGNDNSIANSVPGNVNAIANSSITNESSSITNESSDSSDSENSNSGSSTSYSDSSSEGQESGESSEEQTSTSSQEDPDLAFFRELGVERIAKGTATVVGGDLKFKKILLWEMIVHMWMKAR
jgi:hypothetical protein